MAKRLRHYLNVLISPAQDLPGQWVAHCLELDLVSQGNSPKHAEDMIAEAIEMCADENIRAGRPPFSFRAAPDEVWSMLETAEELAIRPLRISASRIPEDATLQPFVRRAS